MGVDVKKPARVLNSGPRGVVAALAVLSGSVVYAAETLSFLAPEIEFRLTTSTAPGIRFTVPRTAGFSTCM